MFELLCEFRDLLQESLAIRKAEYVRPMRVFSFYAFGEISLHAPVCHRPLFVRIDDGHRPAFSVPGGTEGDCRGALSNAALVVRYGENHGPSMPSLNRDGRLFERQDF